MKDIIFKTFPQHQVKSNTFQKFLKNPNQGISMSKKNNQNHNDFVHIFIGGFGTFHVNHTLIKKYDLETGVLKSYFSYLLNLLRTSKKMIEQAGIYQDVTLKEGTADGKAIITIPFLTICSDLYFFKKPSIKKGLENLLKEGFFTFSSEAPDSYLFSGKSKNGKAGD
jgi:hypothetical protein